MFPQRFNTHGFAGGTLRTTIHHQYQPAVFFAIAQAFVTSSRAKHLCAITTTTSIRAIPSHPIDTEWKELRGQVLLVRCRGFCDINQGEFLRFGLSIAWRRAGQADLQRQVGLRVGVDDRFLVADSSRGVQLVE